MKWGPLGCLDIVHTVWWCTALLACWLLCKTMFWLINTWAKGCVHLGFFWPNHSFKPAGLVRSLLKQNVALCVWQTKKKSKPKNPKNKHTNTHTDNESALTSLQTAPNWPPLQTAEWRGDYGRLPCVSSPPVASRPRDREASFSPRSVFTQPRGVTPPHHRQLLHLSILPRSQHCRQREARLSRWTVEMFELPSAEWHCLHGPHAHNAPPLKSEDNAQHNSNFPARQKRARGYKAKRGGKSAQTVGFKWVIWGCSGKGKLF